MEWFATLTPMLSRDTSSGCRVSVAACLATVFAFGLLALAAGGAVATHEEDRTTDGFKAYTPGGEIPNEGETYTVELYMTPSHMDDEGPIPPDVEVRVEYVIYYSTTISQCDVEDTYVLGIDKGNDDPGTKTDKDMLENLKNNDDYETGPEDDPGKMTTADWDHRQVTYLQFPDEDDFIEPLIIHGNGQEDELIVASEDCVEMPEPGWHRTFGYMNGTVTNITSDRDSVEIDGEEYQEGDHFEIWEPSLWYPVCDCNESRHVSMRLDPPPGKMTPGSGGSIYHPNGTIEAPYAEINESGYIVYDDHAVPPEDVTSEGIQYHDGFLELTGPVYYAAGHVEADGTIVTPNGDRIEPKEDESTGGEETPTEADGSTGTDTPTATPTMTPTEMETEDGEETATEGGDGGAEGTEPPTETATDADDSGGANTTPTAGDGPAPGAIGALLALLVAAMVARRSG